MLEKSQMQRFVQLMEQEIESYVKLIADIMYQQGLTKSQINNFLTEEAELFEDPKKELLQQYSPDQITAEHLSDSIEIHAVAVGEAIKAYAGCIQDGDEQYRHQHVKSFNKNFKTLIHLEAIVNGAKAVQDINQNFPKRKLN